MSDLYVSKRRDLSKHKATTVGKFASTKSDIIPVLTDGKLEADYCYHLEYDRNVVKYECQPLGYYYVGETPSGRRPSYTPDFQIWYKDNSIRYREIKEEKYIDPELEALFPRLQEQAIVLGKPLEMVLDTEIRSEPYFSNLKALFKAKKNRSINTGLLKQIIPLLENNKKISAYQLIDNHELSASIGDFYCLIANYKLKTDIKTQPLSWNMLLEIDSGI